MSFAFAFTISMAVLLPIILGMVTELMEEEG